MTLLPGTPLYRDTLLGVGSVTEATDSRVLVFNKARETRVCELTLGSLTAMRHTAVSLRCVL